MYKIRTNLSIQCFLAVLYFDFIWHRTTSLFFALLLTGSLSQALSFLIAISIFLELSRAWSSTNMSNEHNLRKKLVLMDKIYWSRTHVCSTHCVWKKGEKEGTRWTKWTQKPTRRTLIIMFYHFIFVLLCTVHGAHSCECE